MSFAEMIRRARESKKLTQESLAELADVTDVYVSLIEQGKRIPSDEKAVSISLSGPSSFNYRLREKRARAGTSSASPGGAGCTGTRT